MPLDEVEWSAGTATLRLWHGGRAAISNGDRLRYYETHDGRSVPVQVVKAETMTQDRAARATAERLIARFGKTITLRRTIRSYDPVTGKTTDTAQDYTVKISPPGRFRENLVDGELVRSGDLQAFMAAKGAPVVPEQTTDKAIIDGAPWTLVRVDPVFSGEQAAFYTLHMRK